jgi:translation initiation factor IF-2
MLEPRLKKNFLGRVEVRKVFRLSRSGIVAGSYVTKGKITRSCMVSVVRNGEVVFDGSLSSLKRFKDDVREVAEGFECGISIKGFESIAEGDIIEAYDMEKIARKL